MATYAIKWLKDKLGTRFFPITHLKAVRDDNNTNLESILSDKQDELVSGVNIKTINGNSILGSGNMDVSGGGGGGQANVIESISVNGTGQAVDANKNVNLQFKTVNNNNISGTGNINIAVPTKVSDLTNDAGYITGYTETDPVFAASVAADITSSDITNWNSKTSNIGTITGINMNGASKGTSGVVDLGTVITAHQDISGKADKATTLEGYGITNAYTKTEVDGIVDDYLPLSGGIMTGPLKWANGTAIPSMTSPNYILCIDDLPNATTKWAGKADVSVGSATIASTVTGSYVGGTFLPSAYGKNKVGFQMNNYTVNSNSQYKDWMVMDCYQANNVGGAVALGINRQALGAYILISGGDRASWTSSAELLSSNGQSSDERLKDKVDDIRIKIEDIADAPNIIFTWKDGDNRELHGGSYAQYWEKITPYYVHGDEYKTLEYGNLALSSVIELAKEVVALKEENLQLKNELAEIKEMINKLIK